MAQKEVTLKITVDGKELDVAKTSVEQFDKAYTAAAQKLSTLKVGSEEWKKLNSELENSKKAFDQTKDAANGADGKFKSLRTQIRETTVALQSLADQGKEGSSEFRALSDKLDDLGDAQKRVAFQSGQIEDKLAALPGPIGRIGQGFKAAKESVDTFGKTLTISLGIIGLLVTAFFAIKDALGKTKEGTQLLAQATTAFNKVLAPLFEFPLKSVHVVPEPE
jgi:chromosome segregation ATPase